MNADTVASLTEFIKADPVNFLSFENLFYSNYFHDMIYFTENEIKVKKNLYSEKLKKLYLLV